MDWLLLTPSSVTQLTVITLYTVLTVYLLTRRDKTAATWWLALFCFGFALTFFGWGIPTVVTPAYARILPSGLHNLLGAGGNLLALLAFVQFAYTFQGASFRREARVVLVLTVLLLVVVLLGMLGTSDARISPLGTFGFLCAPLLPLWAVLIFLRKGAHFSQAGASSKGQVPSAHSFVRRMGTALRRPRGDAARACRAFAGLALVLGVMMLTMILIWVVPISPSLFWIAFLLTVLLIAFGLVVLYVNHAPEPSTVQVKLVGAALLTVLALLGILSQVLFPYEETVRESGVTLPGRQTLRFTPDASGYGYTITALPLRLDPAQGERLTLRDDGFEAIPLSFSFPFYGRAWDSLYVGANGVVTFSAPAPSATYNPLDFYRPQPKIAPWFVDLDPAQGGRITFQRSAAAFVVTWDQVPFHSTTVPVTLQLTLHRDGRFEMSTAMPEHDPRPFVSAMARPLGVRGIHPGAAAAPLEALDTARSTALPPGAALVTDYDLQVRRAMHPKAARLAVAVLAATLFVLLVFPYLLRTSLLQPLATLLAGVQRLERGELDARVPLRTPDEVGTLALGFNQMAVSLQEAEQQLRAYAGDLERRVADRTESLRLEKEKTEHLYQLLRQDNLRKTEELEEARALQLAMLPEEPPRLDDLEIAVHMSTATEVGGDYYDFHLADDGTLTVAVGDATGHGLQAGLVVAATKSYFQALVGQGDNAWMLRQIAEGLRGMRLRGLYMSLLLLRYRDGVAHLSVAGMPPVLVYRRATGTVEQARMKGLPLGTVAEFPFEEWRLALTEGDVLVMMTDGLAELLNAHRKPLGLDLILERLQCSAPEGPHAVIDALVDLAHTWTDGTAPTDDVTLIAISNVE